MSPHTSSAARPSRPARRSSPSDISISRVRLGGTAAAKRRSIAIIAKETNMGIFTKDKIDGGPAGPWSAGHLLRRTADPQSASEDDRQGDQPRSRHGRQESSRRDQQTGRTASEGL